jgi:hypothetical protein
MTRGRNSLLSPTLLGTALGGPLLAFSSMGLALLVVGIGMVAMVLSPQLAYYLV